MAGALVSSGNSIDLLFAHYAHPLRASPAPLKSYHPTPSKKKRIPVPMSLSSRITPRSKNNRTTEEAARSSRVVIISTCSRGAEASFTFAFFCVLHAQRLTFGCHRRVYYKTEASSSYTPRPVIPMIYALQDLVLEFCNEQ